MGWIAERKKSRAVKEQFGCHSQPRNKKSQDLNCRGPLWALLRLFPIRLNWASLWSWAQISRRTVISLLRRTVIDDFSSLPHFV